MTTTPTLDPERTAQLRTFLTVEAAADVARTDAATALRHPGRRLALGALATVVVAAGLVVGATVLEWSTGGGRRAEALAIEREGDWTTIRIADIDADPDAVLTELRAAGFDARHEPLVVERSGPNGEQITIHPNERPGHTSVGVASTGESGQQGLAGLTVELPEGEGPLFGSPPPGGGMPAIDDDAGVRMDPDGTVSIRRGAKVTVVVMTEP